MSDEPLSPERAARLLREALSGDPPRHLAYDELAAIVDGVIPAAEQQAHLQECETCRAELNDLRPLARRPPRRRWWLAAAAAAAVLMAILAVLLLRREPPGKAPIVQTTTTGPQQPVIRAEWHKLVDDTLAAGRLPFPPFMAVLHDSGQTFRGEGPAGSQKLAPSGVAVETQRPTLSWPRVDGATYVASIFEDEAMIVQSEPSPAPSWTPPRPLRRGQTYTWQVEATRGGETTVLPAPPAPPARFHVVGAAEQEDLQAARAQRPEDHLLLAVLCARAGLEREARQQLQQSNDPRVRSLR